MKIKKVLFIIILFLFILTICSTVVKAINFEITVTGRHIVKVNRSVNLKAVFKVYNDIYIPGKPNGEMGKKENCNVTNEVVWTSSNPRIARVDSNGKVTGVSSGIVTITANYYGEEESHTIIVFDTIGRKVLSLFLEIL